MMWLQSHVHKKSHEDRSKKLKPFHLMKVINLRANLLFFASPLPSVYPVKFLIDFCLFLCHYLILLNG